jgi:hypothetical protein
VQLHRPRADPILTFQPFITKTERKMGRFSPSVSAFTCLIFETTEQILIKPSSLKEAWGSSETTSPIYQTKQRHIPEDSNQHIHQRKNLQSRVVQSVYRLGQHGFHEFVVVTLQPRSYRKKCDTGKRSVGGKWPSILITDSTPI